MFGTSGEGRHLLMDGLHLRALAISSSLGKLHLRPHDITDLIKHTGVDGRRQNLPDGSEHIVIDYKQKIKNQKSKIKNQKIKKSKIKNSKSKNQKSKIKKSKIKISKNQKIKNQKSKIKNQKIKNQKIHTTYTSSFWVSEGGPRLHHLRPYRSHLRKNK